MVLQKYKEWTALKENITGGEPLNQTLFKMNIKDDTFIFNFKVYDNNIFTFGKKHNDNLYKGDIIEIILTLGSKNEYLEIEVNPENLRYTVIVKNIDKKLDIKKTNFPLISKVTKTPFGWELEIKIKLKDLYKIGFSNESYFAIYRQDFQDSLNLYALNPTYTVSFHEVDRFLKLI